MTKIAFPLENTVLWGARGGFVTDLSESVTKIYYPGTKCEFVRSWFNSAIVFSPDRPISEYFQ
jgi:hypothetical protein